ncbi:hypothetical protein KIS1582_4744 [Cytobacillus firmus]|uniref:Uncharacterized protein n=1 Tax=Cytobacillus firmus TaxID=1399 RepID=A0A800MSE7_CYTFI|nr:hypothetical protein KIS1582_4744 [Cytobacillus firmus]
MHGSFMVFTNKGDGRNFSRPNKRGKCLHVINFTSVLYHDENEQGN